MSTKTRIVGFVAFVLLLFQLMLVCMMFVPVNVVTPHSLEYRPEKCTKNQMCLELLYEKHRSLPGTITIQLVNDHIIVFPKMTSNVVVTDLPKKVLFTVDLPTPMHSGTYEAILTATYRINAFREQSYIIKTEPFTVY